MKTEKHLNRFLWQARQRSGFTQKTVAQLLGRKFIDEISRYENGQRIPSLSTALKLEIIYRVPLRLLFGETYRSCHQQIKEKAGRLVKLFANDLPPITSLEAEFNQSDYCTYTELLNTPNLPPSEKDQIKQHLIDLSHNLNQTDSITN